MKILVSGFVVRKTVAGLAWHYGQYVRGLKRLGHDVIYIEDTESLSGNLDRNLAYAADVFRFLGCEHDWTVFDFATHSWRGPAARRIKQVLRDADVLVNISGSLAVMDWFERIDTRIYIDTDPVFTQAKTIHMPERAHRCARHTAHFSFAENIAAGESGVPGDGFDWRPTRQPIVLDDWETDRSPREAFTTIMSWKSYPVAQAEGKRFGVKSDTFSNVVDLPRKSSALLELALDAEPEVADELRGRGWQVCDAKAVSARIADYRAYIQNSFAELTIAKEAYVSSNSGWFSERSACYLAAGRPVITQETGFSRWMSTGEGILPFRGEEEALAAIDAVRAAYPVHAAAAKEAARLFDCATVLDKLLQDAHGTAPRGPSPGSPAHESLTTYLRFAETLSAVVPDGADLVLVDERRLGVFGLLGKRRVHPFLEKEGDYWGKPESSAQAIVELRRMITEGVAYLVLWQHAFWWKDFYSGWWEFVTRSGKVLHESPELIVIRLADVA